MAAGRPGRVGMPGVAAPDVPAGGHVVLPDKPVAPGAVAAAGAGLEQRAGGGAVVDHVVDDDADAARMCGGDQRVEIGQAAVVGLDAAEIGAGIAVIAVRTGGDGHQPQAADAQVFQVVQPAGQAAQVTDAVAVAVGIGAHEDFHEHAVLPALGQGAGRGLHSHRAGVDGRGHAGAAGQGQQRGQRTAPGGQSKRCKRAVHGGSICSQTTFKHATNLGNDPP